MDELFQEGIDQFIRYQKDVQGKKTRQQKRRDKVQKMIADLHDPQQRRQRHQLRRKQDKAKLQKQLQGLTEQEARVYLDKRAENKRMIKERNLKALETGMPILIDAVFEDKMNEKQNKSLAIQIELIMKALKHIEDPPGIHLCSVAGGLKTQLEKMKYNYWTLTSSPDNIIEVAKKMNKKPVYLSPDAEDQLLAIDPNAAYIIGGLVDRTVMKNASLDRANELEIPTVRLPIRHFMKSRKCLNLDHVVVMLCKFKETGDWKVAFDHGAPKRWKKDQEKGEKKDQNKKQQEKYKKEEGQDESESQSEPEQQKEEEILKEQKAEPTKKEEETKDKPEQA